MWMKVPTWNGDVSYEDFDGWRIWESEGTYWWFHYNNFHHGLTMAHSTNCQHDNNTGWTMDIGDTSGLSFIRDVPPERWEAIKENPVPTITEFILCG